MVEGILYVGNLPLSGRRDRRGNVRGRCWKVFRSSMESSAGGTMRMLRWLKAVVDWMFRDRSMIQLSLEAPNTGTTSRNDWRGPDPPRGRFGPDTGVRVPRWHGPLGRSASAAVAEPTDDKSVVAIAAGPQRVSGHMRENEMQVEGVVRVSGRGVVQEVTAHSLPLRPGIRSES